MAAAVLLGSALVLEATSPTGAAAEFAATATSPRGTVALSYSAAPGSTFALGETTVTATATNADGAASRRIPGADLRSLTPPHPRATPGQRT